MEDPSTHVETRTASASKAVQMRASQKGLAVRRGYVWWLGVHPDVIKDPSDLHALGNERDQAHLPTAQRAQQREHLVDARDQHGPQVVRR